MLFRAGTRVPAKEPLTFCFSVPVCFCPAQLLYCLYCTLLTSATFVGGERSKDGRAPRGRTWTPAVSQPIGQREGPLLADSQDVKDLHLVTDELLWVDFPGNVQWCRSIFSFSFALTSKTQLRTFRCFFCSLWTLCVLWTFLRALDVSTCSLRTLCVLALYGHSACSGRSCVLFK